jgi:hypothetical protein
LPPTLFHFLQRWQWHVLWTIISGNCDGSRYGSKLDSQILMVCSLKNKGDMYMAFS